MIESRAGVMILRPLSVLFGTVHGGGRLSADTDSRDSELAQSLLPDGRTDSLLDFKADSLGNPPSGGYSDGRAVG
jgi:hypothetical protein